MSDPRPATRRDLLKPVQLLAFAFGAAVFAGVISLVSMGVFQDHTGPEREHVIVVSLVVAGIAFIASLVIIALLMLAVDPAQVTKPVDRAVLLPAEEPGSAAASQPGGPAAEPAPAEPGPAEPGAPAATELGETPDPPASRA